MSALQALNGLVISKIEEMHGYIQVLFSDGATLSIFNTYVYDSGSVLSIADKTVQSVKESESSVVIFFESGESVLIGVNDDDYNGPEAMVLRRQGKSPVVWN